MASSEDTLQTFLLPTAGVRGAHVSLDATWADIGARAEYPAAIQRLLGEACAASALFTGHVKVDGRLSVQLRSDGPIRTLFAECTAAGTLRGIVRIAEGSPMDDAPTDLAGAVLAITIENRGASGREPTRYQGLVSVEHAGLDRAFETYFEQSEQLPTRILLAASAARACGILLQRLPGDAGDEDGWTRAGLLFDTLGAQELLDLDGAELLHRLFHEEEVAVTARKPLAFGCSCSLERVQEMLKALGEDEAHAAAADTGEALIHCEFCGAAYRLSASEIEGLFAPSAPRSFPPGRLQ